MRRRAVLALAALCLLVFAQNYDEWRERRRPEILALFEEHVYGKAPGRPKGVLFEVTSIDAQALGGQATRKEVKIYFGEDRR